MRGVLTWVIGAVVLPIMGGCTDRPVLDDEDGRKSTTDTTESGRIEVTNLDLATSPDDRPLALVERFRIGALDSGGPDMFGEVRDLELGSEGELYVLDGQASEIRVFDGEGAYLRTIGRPGEGPGELRVPAGLALDSDGTLWVMNWRNARYTGFDPSSGEVRREVRRLASFAAFPWLGAFDENDRLLDVSLDRSGDPAIIRLDTAFVPADTILLPTLGAEHMVAFRRDGRMAMSAVDPFAPRPAWAPGPDGGIVVGEGGEYRIHRVDLAGDTSLTISLLREPTRVTAAERDSALAAFDLVAELADGATPDRRPRVSATKPAHGPLSVDDEDRIWVHALFDGQAVWDVFAPTGLYLGRIPVPLVGDGMRVTVRDGRLALALQLNGVPTVVVYELTEVR